LGGIPKLLSFGFFFLGALWLTKKMPELDFGRTKYSTSALQKDAQKLQDEL